MCWLKLLSFPRSQNRDLGHPPALIFAGMFARQKERPPSRGTLRTDTFTFGALLTTFLIVVTALSYLPMLTLGPVLESLLYKI